MTNTTETLRRWVTNGAGLLIMAAALLVISLFIGMVIRGL